MRVRIANRRGNYWGSGRIPTRPRW